MKYEEIVANVKEVITQKGMKQNIVAKRAGMSPQALSDIINGRKLLRVEHMPNLAHALGVDIEEFFYQRD